MGFEPTALCLQLYQLSCLHVDEMCLVEWLNTGSSDREAYKLFPSRSRYASSNHTRGKLSIVPLSLPRFSVNFG